MPFKIKALATHVSLCDWAYSCVTKEPKIAVFNVQLT